MKESKWWVGALAALVMFLVLNANASAASYKVDPQYTQIVFKIKHIMGQIRGVFAKFDGEVKLDEADQELKSLTATVEVESIDTHVAERDKDLRSEKFFDTAKFPQAKFVSKKISKDKIVGELTMHGVTKEISLDYTLYGVAMDQRGNTKVFLSAAGTVNRKDFGITFNTNTDDGKLLLGDDVELAFEVQGILEK